MKAIEAIFADGKKKALVEECVNGHGAYCGSYGQ